MPEKHAGMHVRLAFCGMVMLGMFGLAAPASNGRDWEDGWGKYKLRSYTSPTYPTYSPQPFFKDTSWYDHVDTWIALPLQSNVLGCKCEALVLQFSMNFYGADQTPSRTYRGKPVAAGLTALCRSGIIRRFISGALVMTVYAPERKLWFDVPTRGNLVSINRIYPAEPDTTIWLDDATVRQLWRAVGVEAPRTGGISVPKLESDERNKTIAKTPGEQTPAISEYVRYDRAPVLISMPKPRYPDSAQISRVSGTVVVLALIGEDGKVRDTRVQKAQPMFDDSAMEAVRNSSWGPALNDGKPVALWASVPIRYSLRDIEQK